MSYDFERMAMLLDVVHKQATIAPQLTSLAGAAMDELNSMHDDIKADRAKAADAQRQKELDAVAKLEAQRKKQADKDAETETPNGIAQRLRNQPKPIPSGNIDTTPGQPSLLNKDAKDETPIVERRV
jgi:Skp family chaperone for outer membrane proteins